jgi:cell division protein FtsQ
MKKAFEILSWLMLIAVIVLLMAFSVKNQQLVECQKFEVMVASSENHFINDKMINELLSNINLHPLGKTRAEIAMDEIEKSIGNHTSIKEVNAYFDIAGNVFVEILQRSPIARVATENNSFYIDENGKRMPLSKVYTARRLVITGKVNFQEKGELFLLAKFINENPFWKAQIMQIHTEENGDLILIPRVGYQQIVFGKPINIATKFNKLKLFYEKGISERGWNNYSHINLKFKNQIVCTKK